MVYKEKAVCDFTISGGVKVNIGDTVSVSENRVITVTKYLGNGEVVSYPVFSDIYYVSNAPSAEVIAETITKSNVIKLFKTNNLE